MKLGFIGTGKITSSVISGICSSKINYKKIFISSRNSLIARRLKKRFKKILIEKDNQTEILSISLVSEDLIRNESEESCVRIRHNGKISQSVNDILTRMEELKFI